MIKSYCDVCGKEQDRPNYVTLEMVRKIIPNYHEQYAVCTLCFYKVKKALEK